LKDHRITRPALDHVDGLRRENFIRFGNMRIADHVTVGEAMERLTVRDGVIDLKPESPADRRIAERLRSKNIPARESEAAAGEQDDVARRRRDWDEAKRTGDPDAMTRTANALLRAAEEARAHLGPQEGARAAPREGGPHPTRAILNPGAIDQRFARATRNEPADTSTESIQGDVDVGPGQTAIATEDGVHAVVSPRANGGDVGADEVGTEQSQRSEAATHDGAPPGQFAMAPNGPPLWSAEQAHTVANAVASVPEEERLAMLLQLRQRFGSRVVRQVLELLPVKDLRERQSDFGPRFRRFDRAHGVRRPTPGDALLSAQGNATDEAFSPVGWFDWLVGEDKEPQGAQGTSRHSLKTAQLARELQFFAYDPANLERGVPGWSGPLLVFDDVFPAGLPQPLNRRFFRQNRRGFGGYLVQRRGARDYAFLIKGVELSDSDRRGSDVESALLSKNASVGQINEVAEDVYQQLKAKGVFRDVKAGGSLLLTGHSQGAPQAQLLAVYLITRAIQDRDNQLSEAEALRGITVRAFGGAGARSVVGVLRGPNGKLEVPRSVLENIDAITYLLTGDPARWSEEPYVGEAWLVDTPDERSYTPTESWAIGPLRSHPGSAYRAADYSTARRDTHVRRGNSPENALFPPRE
jgi:hypothetical protein